MSNGRRVEDTQTSATDDADAPTKRADTGEMARRAIAYVADEPERRSEEQLLNDLGVDPEDPELDTALRELEAGVTDDLPFGTPGPPTSARSPFFTAVVAALGVLLVAALAVAAYVASDIIVVVVIAGFLATGLDPAVRWIEKHGRVPRGVAVAGVVGVAGLLLAAFAVFGAPALVTQANELRQDAPRYAEQLRNSNPALADLDRRVGWVALVRDVTADRQMQGPQAREGLMDLAVNVIAGGIAALTCITLTIYFLARFQSLKRTAYRLVPRSRRARATLLIDEILARIGGYVLGNIATSAVAGLTAYVALKIAGVPHALALAIFVGLTDMIPLVGATLGAALCAAVAFTVSVTTGVAMLAFFFLYQQFENLVLIPRVMHRTVEVSPVATIVAILIGAALLGVLGALLAVPVAAAIQLIATHVWAPRQEAR